MAINFVTRPPSNQQHYDEFWSGDPAFVQGEGAEHERKIERARETGDWSELLIQGSTPTKFVMRQIPGEIKRRILDRFIAGKSGGYDLDSLLLRLAVVDVIGLGDFKLRFTADEDWGKLATHELPNILDEFAPGCVAELGLAVYRKMMGPSGK